MLARGKRHPADAAIACIALLTGFCFFGWVLATACAASGIGLFAVLLAGWVAVPYVALAGVAYFLSTGWTSRAVLLVALATSIGVGTWALNCVDEDPQGENVNAALQEELRQLILDANQLSYVAQDFPPDGGSVVFHFRTNKGEDLIVWALHHDEAMGGNSKYQEIRLCDPRHWEQHVELKPGSRLETRLLRLLKKPRISDSFDRDREWTRPTEKGLAWLVKRIADRQTEWNQDL